MYVRIGGVETDFFRQCALSRLALALRLRDGVVDWRGVARGRRGGDIRTGIDDMAYI